MFVRCLNFDGVKKIFNLDGIKCCLWHQKNKNWNNWNLEKNLREEKINKKIVPKGLATLAFGFI